MYELTIAVAIARLNNCQRPVLFRPQNAFYVTVDKQALSVASAPCFCDAVQFLVQLFYVLNLLFPYELKSVYGFLEHMIYLPVDLHLAQLCAVCRLGRLGQ